MFTSKPLMALNAFLATVALTLGIMVVVAAPAQADTWNRCNDSMGYAGWLCMSDDTSGQLSQISISSNSHYCINLPPWNDYATFVSNRLNNGRAVRVYWDVNCGGESHLVNNGVGWVMDFHWIHEASSVYLYS